MSEQEDFTVAVNFRRLVSLLKQERYVRLPTGLEILALAKGDDFLYRWTARGLLRDSGFRDSLEFYMAEV